MITFLNPKERENPHLNAGNKYNSLKNKSRIFYNIEVNSDSSFDKLKKKIDQLANQKDNLNEESPIIPSWAYKIAKKGIKSGEAEYKVG